MIVVLWLSLMWFSAGNLMQIGLRDGGMAAVAFGVAMGSGIVLTAAVAMIGIRK